MTNIRQLTFVTAISVVFLSGLSKSMINSSMVDLENLLKLELSKHREGCQEMDVLAVEVRHDEDDILPNNKVFEYTIRCTNRGIQEICEVFFIKNTDSEEDVKNFIVDCK